MVLDDDLLKLSFLKAFLEKKKDHSWNFVRFIIPKIIEKYFEDVKKIEIYINLSRREFNKYFYNPDGQEIILAFILNGLNIECKRVTLVKNKHLPSYLIVELNPEKNVKK